VGRFALSGIGFGTMRLTSMFSDGTRHDWRILRFSNAEWSGHFETAQDALLFLQKQFDAESAV
jgi:hypothetical protein